MRPYLITEPEAAKLPRWGLLLLCLLHVVPGFVWRDPWISEDAIGFGIARTMAEGEARDWLMPNVHGWPIAGEGPLPHWLVALALRALPFVDAHFLVRLLAAAWLGLSLAAAWYACWHLARRPEAQPPDPFGASPSAVDYGRAVADVALLLVLAAIGPLPRVHETTADAFGFGLPAFFLLGMARALDAPRGGGLLAGLAIGAAWLSVGPALGSALLVSLLLLALRLDRLRLVARQLLPVALMTASLVGLSWPLLLAAVGGEGPVVRPDAPHDWWQANLQGFALRGPTALPGILGSQALNASWFLWPAWPIALWTLWRGMQGRRGAPVVALPATVLGATLLAVLALQPPSATALLPLAVPCAILGAAGLPTLARRALSLVDWFAVMVFTLFGLGLWAYWLAWQTGWPPRMAASIVRLAPGLEPGAATVGRAAGVVFAMAASLAWLLLVRWRLARQPRALWRAVVLSAGGLVLSWVLLMSLWLPVFEYRRSARELVVQLERLMPPGTDCVSTDGVRPGMRAGLAYLGGLRLAPDQSFAGAPPATDCGWLLEGEAARAVRDLARWMPAGEIRRPFPRGETLRLYRRIDVPAPDWRPPA